MGEGMDRIEELLNARNEIIKLKQRIVDMRKECNRRFSEQLQKIRKLEAEKMLQIQDTLFEDSEKPQWSDGVNNHDCDELKDGE